MSQRQMTPRGQRLEYLLALLLSHLMIDGLVEEG